MQIARRSGVTAFLAVAVAVVGLAGCTSYHVDLPYVQGAGIAQTHSKPMWGGYYANFDQAAVAIEVTPVKSINPVGTQHVLIATVKDKDGKPLSGRRVEWIILDGGVGDIVEVDESVWWGDRGYKVDSHNAISHTNEADHVITRGNDESADDIHLKRGQTWCVITSGFEGTTRVCAYAPAIFNWDEHKVFADKHWYDVKWQWPAPATNPLDTPHQFTTRVMKYSDGSALAGYIVSYKILSGPKAVFMPGGGTTASVKSDAQGMATVTLKQVGPAEGVNQIQVDIIRPPDQCRCQPALHLATGKTSKTWIGPKITITKTAPARARVGQTFEYRIVVANPSQVPAPQVVVSDSLPSGISYVSAVPTPKVAANGLSWALGTLAPGAQKAIAVTVRATRTGRFDNCATVRAAYGLSGKACAPTVVWEPKLTIEKTGPAEVLICDPITYRIVVRNTGEGPITNVRITDTLPAGLVTTDGRSTASFAAKTLNPGEATQAVVNVTAKKRGTFVNQAMVTADLGLKAQATARTVVREPVLVITKTGPKVRYIGRSATYTITVANRGDGAAVNTTLVDAIPVGARFMAASDGGTFNEGRVAWNLGTLAPNASKRVTLKLGMSQRGTMRNTASATARCTAAKGELTTLVKGIPAILLEVVDIDDPIELGARTTYEIVVTNQGSAEGTNIVIVATLPPQETYVSAQGPTQATVAGKVITFAPLAKLDPKAKATYRVVVKGTTVGDVRFGVSLKSDQMTSPVAETESTHIYE